MPPETEDTRHRSAAREKHGYGSEAISNEQPDRRSLRTPGSACSTYRRDRDCASTWLESGRAPFPRSRSERHTYIDIPPAETALSSIRPALPLQTRSV